MALDLMTDEDEDTGVEITRFVRNGIEYPQKTVGSCIVCNHPDRLSIETLYMQGRRPTRIIQILGNADTINSPQNITSHFQRGHVAPHKELVVSTMLAKAQAQGVSLGEWEEGQRQEILVTEMMVNKFRARLVEDEDFVPDFKEGLAAAKLLYEMNSGIDTSFDPTDLYVALSVFMAHTRSVIAAYAGEDVQDAMGTLSKLLQGDPLLKNLITKTKSDELPPMIDAVDDSEEEDIFDGEVVESRTNWTPTSSEEEIPFDEIDDED